MLQPGDTILGMNLAHGGHLTHGHHLNFSGKTVQSRPLWCPQRRRAHRLRRAGAAGRRAQAEDDHRGRERLSADHRFRAIPRDCGLASGALFLVDMAHFSGLVAAGLYPNPCEYADIVTSTTHKTLRGPRSGLILAQREVRRGDRQERVSRARRAVRWSTSSRPRPSASSKRCSRSSSPTSNRLSRTRRRWRQALSEEGFRVVSGGTDTHLLLVDVFAKGVRGKEAETALDKAYITVNKNGIPFDINPPLNPSGIRLGSPAVTTRGFP